MAENMLDKLKSEVSNNNGGGFSYRTPKHHFLKLGRKNAENVRIIPYLDRDFWFPFRMTWVDIPSPDGKQMYSNPLYFSYTDNGDDKLRTLVAKIIKYNFQYRADSKNDKTTANFTGDKIPLQFKHANKPHYNATLRPQFALQAVNIVKDANGNPTMQRISGSDIPLAQLMTVPKSVMGIISESIGSNDINTLESYADKSTGKPFPYEGNYDQVRWISVKDSFPIYIHMNSDNRYQVDPHNMQPLGPINKALYATDSKGKFLHLDDPAYIFASTKDQAPQLWKKAYSVLSKRWNKEQNANGGKSYAEPTINKAKAVRKNVGNDNSQTQATGNQSNPYDRPAQSSTTGQHPTNTNSNPVNSASTDTHANGYSNRPSSSVSSSSTDNSDAPADDDSKSTGSNIPQSAQDKGQVSSSSSNSTPSKKDLNKMDPNDIINQALNGGK